MDHSPRPNSIRWALMLGIVIVLNIFFFEAVALIIPAPRYETYCPTQQVVPIYTTETACMAGGGQWTANPQVPTMRGGAAVAGGYCNGQYACGERFSEAITLHARNAFVAFLILGIISLIVGILPLGSSIVSSGLAYGGVAALLIGSAQYWGTASVWARLIIAFIGLALLLYVGFRQFSD